MVGSSAPDTGAGQQATPPTTVDAHDDRDALNDSSTQDAPSDGPVEAAPDASKDVSSGDGCVPPPPASTVYASKNCDIIGPCSTCADGLPYRCGQRLGTAQPGYFTKAAPFSDPVPSCRLLVNGGVDNKSEFCCPPACVESGDHQAACANDRTPVVCPTANNLPLLIPPVGCLHAEPGYPDTQTLYCCK